MVFQMLKLYLISWVKKETTYQYISEWIINSKRVFKKQKS